MFENTFFKVSTCYIVNFKISSVFNLQQQIRSRGGRIEGVEDSGLLKRRARRDKLSSGDSNRNLFLSNYFSGVGDNKDKNYRKKLLILYRNLLLFFFLCKTYFNEEVGDAAVHIFVKPFFIKHITFLRAPYRYKLGRYQVSLVRYAVLVSAEVSKNSLENWFMYRRLVRETAGAGVLPFFYFIKNNFSNFETNICYLHQHKFTLFTFGEGNFLLNPSN